MKKFERADMTTLRADIDEALEAVAKKHGISLKAGSAKFSPISFKMTIEGEVLDEAGASAEAKAEWGFYRTMFGFEASDFGRQFAYKREIYKITGINANAPKYPIQAVSIIGAKPMRFPIELVKRGFLAVAA